MNTHRIHRVAKLTGLTKDVIRVWERRYGLVQPLRSANRYREYTDEDVALLRFVKSELDQGASIGELTANGREPLIQRMRSIVVPSPHELAPHETLLDSLIALLDPLKKPEFEYKLNAAVAVIPFEEALQRILLPLQQRIGEMWHEGRVNVAVEHYVTKIVQQKLFAVMNQLPGNEFGPRVLIGCPAGEPHEIGAQAVAYLAATKGCQTYYLGPNLPLADLQQFADRLAPDLILLSLTQAPAHPAPLIQDLTALTKAAPVAVGGQGALAIRESLEEAKIELLADLPALHDRLTQLISKKMAAHFAR